MANCLFQKKVGFVNLVINSDFNEKNLPDEIMQNIQRKRYRRNEAETAQSKTWCGFARILLYIRAAKEHENSGRKWTKIKTIVIVSNKMNGLLSYGLTEL